MKLRILVINLNNIDYTEACVEDLLRQTNRDFELVLFDQASTELHTHERLIHYQHEPGVKLIFNASNTPLNTVWNWFYETSRHQFELLCFLNNDVRLTRNFVDDTLALFEQEAYVGVAGHATNHENYQRAAPKLEYQIAARNKHLQGWDFTIRSSLYRPIPSILQTYCGDDYLFQQVYNSGYHLAYITSSPIIHYEGASKKDLREDGMLDTERFLSLGLEKNLAINENFSRIKPSFQQLQE